MAHEVKDIAPGQARGLMDAGWRVLDVRTDAEWADGHIAGSHHLPMDQVVEELGGHAVRATARRAHDEQGVVRVAQYLAQQGLEVANLDGGLHAWEAAGLPLER
jgi:rhodanese-related sulfurtransferase